jgi:hypothetical protein
MTRIDRNDVVEPRAGGPAGGNPRRAPPAAPRGGRRSSAQVHEAGGALVILIALAQVVRENLRNELEGQEERIPAHPGGPGERAHPTAEDVERGAKQEPERLACHGDFGPAVNEAEGSAKGRDQ